MHDRTTAIETSMANPTGRIALRPNYEEIMCERIKGARERYVPRGRDGSRDYTQPRILQASATLATETM